MHWKYEADKNLVARTAFTWTILRPGGLTEGPGTGKASIGRTHMIPTIPASLMHTRCSCCRLIWFHRGTTSRMHLLPLSTDRMQLDWLLTSSEARRPFRRASMPSSRRALRIGWGEELLLRKAAVNQTRSVFQCIMIVECRELLGTAIGQ